MSSDSVSATKRAQQYPRSATTMTWARRQGGHRVAHRVGACQPIGIRLQCDVLLPGAHGEWGGDSLVRQGSDEHVDIVLDRGFIQEQWSPGGVRRRRCSVVVGDHGRQQRWRQRTRCHR